MGSRSERNCGIRIWIPPQESRPHLTRSSGDGQTHSGTGNRKRIPKKSGRLLRQGAVEDDIFAVIFYFDEEGQPAPRYPVTMMCRVCDVSTAGYYAWKKRLNTPPAASTPRGRRAVITRRVVELFHRHHRCAGARTLWRDLRHEGIEVTVYGVRKIMAEQKLFTKYRTLRKRTTIPDPGVCKRKDLVHRNFSPAVPTTALCGDITSLRTPQGWMYQAHGHGYGHQDDRGMADC